MTTANGFSAIVGQQQPIALLRTFIVKEKLPHALLFTGDEGIGKKMTARAFAMACNCLRVHKALREKAHDSKIDACGLCTPCKKIAAKVHPDIVHVHPQTSVIKIAQIRSLLEILTLKPNEANHRVVILSEAHTMNTQAANALLKALEEPPDRTLLLLTANHTSNLLPTIVSRCRHIPFFPLDSSSIKQLLRPSDRLTPKALDMIAGLSQGSFTRATTYADAHWIEQRNRIVRRLGDLLIPDGSDPLRSWLAFSETLSKNKDRLEESLEIVTMWLRDLLFVHYDPKRLINRDSKDMLVKVAKSVGPKLVVDYIEAVEAAQSALRSNTNTRLTMDAMVLKIMGPNHLKHTDV